MSAVLSVDAPQGLKERVLPLLDKETGEIARTLGVNEVDVLRAFPEGTAVELSAEKFLPLMKELSTWGTLRLIVLHHGSVFEIKGSIPEGKEGMGYYNLHSPDSPIGGHLRMKDSEGRSFLGPIFLVTKPFRGKTSYCIQFYNAENLSMFKLFLDRDESREVVPHQMKGFEKLKTIKLL